MLTAPADYAEDARLYLDLLADANGSPPHSVLEYRAPVAATTPRTTNTRLRPHWSTSRLGMLALSQRLNPECEHLQGDMRSIRLGRTFDAVLVQDAVLYLTTEADLRSTMVTAFEHCRPGGVAVFAPDYTRESFAPATIHGGHDGDGRALRYLAWIWDPDPTDTTYVVDFAYLFHEDDRPMRVTHDRHIHGLFGRGRLAAPLREVGFEPARAALRAFRAAHWLGRRLRGLQARHGSARRTIGRAAMAQSNKVLITDHAWPDVQVETALLSAAGLQVVDAPRPTRRPCAHWRRTPWRS